MPVAFAASWRLVAGFVPLLASRKDGLLRAAPIPNSRAWAGRFACLAESPSENDHRKFLYVAVLRAGQCKHGFVACGADRFVEILCS